MYSVDENDGAVEIQLIFSNPSSINITVEVNSDEINATSELTLTYTHTCMNYTVNYVDVITKCVDPNYFHLGNVDYDAGPYNVMFSAGETIKSFNILIFNNNTFEALESFNLVISPSNFIILGDPHQAITTITDDDCELIIIHSIL